jgi:hypothetical protein
MKIAAMLQEIDRGQSIGKQNNFSKRINSMRVPKS